MARRTITRSDLEERVDQACDIQGSGDRFVSEEERTALVNRCICDMHTVMASIEEDWVVTTLDVVITGSFTELPDDHWQMRAVDRLNSDGTVTPLRPFQNEERGNSTFGCSSFNDNLPRWNVQNDIISFMPINQDAGSLRIKYVPDAPQLSTADAVLPRYLSINNWDEFIVVSAAAKILMKKGEDVSELWAERDRIKVEMMMWARRNRTGQKTVSLVRTAYDDLIFGGHRGRMVREGGY